MDLGIRGRTAIVCGASRGLGKACAAALAREGVTLTIVARGAAALTTAALEIAGETGVTVTPVAADITTPQGRAAVLRPAQPRISSSTMPTAACPATSALGRARIGSTRSTP